MPQRKRLVNSFFFKSICLRLNTMNIDYLLDPVGFQTVAVVYFPFSVRNTQNRISCILGSFTF
ncbi:hypothetical protein CY34DRAFT_269954 [Suillus luteus UH-Slu-Lm8-n1]|uniref:Uncharacterized protein n=1 Tax=Suillus luteus UH-Slu-Lm8-n1 TaxID=930992 RepID=A0A0D0ABH3_9AGAM|nr:hypothetical protein CY34DRAFT_269954 [Suillus luteus UH-Slu-Lm8-n1]